MPKCLYIGRFQPFHLGHLDVVDQIFGYGYNHIVIGVGSSNKQNEKNPWTFSQRKQMIEASLCDSKRDLACFDIVGIPDVHDDEEWLTYIIQTIDFDVIMSGNPWVVGIFERHGFHVLEEVERIPMHGTDIRGYIHDAAWDTVQVCVTPSVYQYLRSIVGHEI